MTDHGEVFKFEVTLVTKVVSSLGELDTHDVFDSYTEFSVCIVARLVGNHMTSLESCIVVVWLWSNSLWSFVDIQE